MGLGLEEGSEDWWLVVLTSASQGVRAEMRMVLTWTVQITI